MDYIALSQVYDALGATTKRLEKTGIIADFLKKIPENDLADAILLLQGRVFARWDKRTIGVSSKLAAKAIAQTAGVGEKDVTKLWRNIGDLGKVTEELLSRRRQATLFTQQLVLKDVASTLRSLASMEGSGSVDRKLKTITGLLSAAEPGAVKYLLGTILEELRVGVAEGIVRDAIVWAFFDAPVENNEIIADKREIYNQLVEVVQGAYDRCSDFGTVAKIAREEGVLGLKKITFELGTPIRVMLAQREADVHAALERIGRPGALEYKYDGFRVQVHKNKDEVRLFTRRLEEVTAQFPEVVEYIRKYVRAQTCLIDCEAVGYDKESGKYTPFQAISQRIRRKYDIEDLSERLPVELVIFDILYLDGEEVLERPFSERRALLRTILSQDHDKYIRLSAYLETQDDEAGEQFYKDSMAAGNEGLMAKNLSGVYKPGARVGHMVKIKPTLDSLDLVIVGAEWGEGKRSGWLTSFTLACYDPAEDEFLTVGKVGTGLKELDSDDSLAVTFERLTKLLQEDILEQSGREVVVKPRIILEIKFEEIQKSPTYTSGYALRFPRVVQLREDRGTEDMSSVDEVDVAYRQQRSRA